MTGSPSARAWAALALLGLIWGGSFLGIEIALTGFGPLWVAAGRITLAAAILTAAAFASRHGLPPTGTSRGRRIWLHCVGMGVFSNALPFALLSWGQRHVTSGFAGITMAVVPLLVLPLAHLFVPGERMTARKVAGFVIGFAGVVVLIGPGATDADALGLARLACVAASCCYAVGAIITRLAPAGPYLAFAAGGLLVAAALILPLALAIEGWPDPGLPALLGVLYLGIFPTAVATVLLVFVVQSAGPSFMSLVNYQVPVWAVIIGMVALDEELPPQFLGALVLILAGLAVSQARITRATPAVPAAAAGNKVAGAGSPPRPSR
jgi:drug/metabolite transporter (DMT)-like permease